MKKINKLIWKYIPHSVISLGKFLFQGKSFLYEVGYLKTLWTNKPRSKNGEPIPWLDYGFIKFLMDKLPSDARIFEYGMGMSTQFYASRSASVTAVEHYEKWFEQTKDALGNLENVSLLFKQLDNNKYADSINDGGDSYDMVIVDGRDRVSCAKSAVDCLSDRGVVIFDDGERAKYLPIYSYMADRGYNCLKFYGLRPSSCYFESTVLFYRKGSNLFDI